MATYDNDPYGNLYQSDEDPARPRYRYDNTPGYLRQQNNPSWTGGISNMIRAIMQGNDEYQKAHPKPAPGTGQGQGAAGAGGPPDLPYGSRVPGAIGPSSVGGAQLSAPPRPPPPRPNIPMPQPRPFGAGASPVAAPGIGLPTSPNVPPMAGTSMSPANTWANAATGAPQPPPQRPTYSPPPPMMGAGGGNAPPPPGGVFAGGTSPAPTGGPTSNPVANALSTPPPTSLPQGFPGTASSMPAGMQANQAPGLFGTGVAAPGLNAGATAGMTPGLGFDDMSGGFGAFTA